MPRKLIPGVIALGMILVVVWLVFKPATQPPIGGGLVPSAAPILNAEGPDSDTLASLQATLSALAARLDVLEAGQKVNPSSVPVPSATTGSTQAVFQTQVLYLGSGSTTQRDWTESGAQVWVDSRDYPSGVKATFEAGLSIIGGEAWARLKNKTSGAILSITEISHNNSTATWKTSPVFQLNPGNNLYVVELKSSSDESAILSGSRVKLFQ